MKAVLPTLSESLEGSTSCSVLSAWLNFINDQFIVCLQAWHLKSCDLFNEGSISLSRMWTCEAEKLFNKVSPWKSANHIVKYSFTKYNFFMHLTEQNGLGTILLTLRRARAQFTTFYFHKIAEMPPLCSSHLYIAEHSFLEQKLVYDSISAFFELWQYTISNSTTIDSHPAAMCSVLICTNLSHTIGNDSQETKLKNDPEYYLFVYSFCISFLQF